MSALTYMQRRASGTYEFRKRLPETLAGKPVPLPMREPFSELVNAITGCFKRELVRSLETKDPKEAKRHNHREALRAAQLFDAALRTISGEPTQRFADAELREIESEVLAELLTTDATERVDGDDRRRLHTAEDREKWPDLVPAVNIPPGQPRTSTAMLDSAAKGMTRDHFHVYGEHIGELADEYREAWARSDPTIVRVETRVTLKRRDALINESSPEFREVGLAVLKAHVRAYELIGQRQGGGIIDTPIAVRRDRGERGPKLSEALASWRAGGTAKGAKKPAAKSVVEAELAVRSFRQLHGDMPIGDITREHARAFRDAMVMVPKALPKNLRDLPLPVLLKRDLSQFQPRNATTVNKLMSLAGGIISQAERDGVLDNVVPPFVNPFTQKMRLALIEGDEARQPFDKADLRAIFTSPVYTTADRPEAGGGEASFWFPLIALLSGMRLDEIAQLRACDIRQDDESGRWFFDIARTGGRRTKNAHSIRHIPVHPDLTRIGLLRYRQGLLDEKPNSESPLWPGVPLSARWSKWFGRHLRGTVGITAPAKVFHSFRHTFKRMTRDAGLPEELHDALTGHAGRGGMGRSYGKGYSLAPLIAAMDTVAAPIALDGIAWADANSLRFL
jgi:hypothetical protein